MSKILLFSDLHCHMHKQSISRLNDCLQVLKWVFDTAIAKGIKIIVFTGDLFQDRQKIHVISYEKTFGIINKYCEENPDLQLFLLVGNHDMWYNEKWDVSSVAPLQVIKNVKVISQPCSLEVGDSVMDFLPYTKNPIKDIETYFPIKNDVLFSHCSVNGAQLNSFNNTKAEISVEHEGDMVKVDVNAFKDWRKVFLGHYHCAQKLNDTVEYVGSPLELNFGEAFQEKHIVIFDTKTFASEYVVNDFSPKHLIVKEKDIMNHDLDNNFVQIIVDDIASTDLIDMKKTIKGCATLEFKEKPHKKDDSVKALDLTGDILEEWVNAKGYGSMKRERLISIVQDIIKRT